MAIQGFSQYGVMGPAATAANPAVDPMQANLSTGSASDDLKSLLQLFANRSNALNPTLDSINSAAPQATTALTNAIANQNTATGLSPQALAAMRTQATSGINDQYQSAAQAVNSQLLRRGAAGQATLPGSGGDISRAYQPLYSAMEAAKSKATEDTIMADEAAKQKSLYQNQQLAQNAANSVFGNTTSVFNAGNAALGQAGSTADALASLEGPSLTKLLATSLATGAATGTGPGGSILSKAISKIPGLGPSAASAASPALSAALAGHGASAMGGLVDFSGLPLSDAAGTAGAATAAGATAPAGATGLTGALGLGGGSGLFGLGAATIPVVGGAIAGIGLLAKHFFGNGGDRMAANQLTQGPNSVHAFFDQATAQINQMPDGPDKDAAINARDRNMEDALVGFSKKDKNSYYQAKATLEQFSKFSGVRALLG